MKTITKKMTKKEIKDDIIRMVEIMESNSFLLPDSWTDEIQMNTKDFGYKTYVGRRGSDRYINIEINSNIKISIRGNNISIENENLFDKRTTVNELYNYIKDIFEEKHSFEIFDEAVSKLRLKIRKANKDLKSKKDYILTLKKELKDSEKLNK